MGMKKVNVLKTPFNELVDKALAEITEFAKDCDEHGKEMKLFGKYKIRVMNVFGKIYIRKLSCYTAFPMQHSLYVKLNATISAIPSLCFVIDEDGNREDTSHRASYNSYATLEDFLRGIIEYEKVRAEGRDELSQIIKKRKEALKEKRDLAKQGFFKVDDKVLKEIIKKNGFGKSSYAKSIISKGMRFFVFADVYRVKEGANFYNWVAEYINLAYLDEDDELKCISLNINPHTTTDLRRKDKITYIKLFLEKYKDDKDVANALDTILAFESV